MNIIESINNIKPGQEIVCGIYESHITDSTIRKAMYDAYLAGSGVPLQREVGIVRGTHHEYKRYEYILQGTVPCEKEIAKRRFYNSNLTYKGERLKSLVLANK